MDDIVERPATGDDLAAFANLFAAADAHDIGEVFLNETDIEAAWRSPGVDIHSDTQLMWLDGVLVGAAMVIDWKAWGTVHPDYRGRGLGTRLVEWTEERAEDDRIGQTFIDSLDEARRLFTDRGYRLLYSSWILRYREHRDIPDPKPPEGITIRPIQPSEEQAAYQVVEDAFNEWPNRTPSTFEEWRAETIERSDFDRSLMRVAIDGDTVIGSIFGIQYPEEGWVDELAVAAPYRRRGIARALIASVFGEFRSRGQGLVGLNTDSRTGALDVYLGLGMELERTFVHYSKPLRSE
jgi:GNAT superfamily N-acetyltransferase